MILDIVTIIIAAIVTIGSTTFCINRILILKERQSLQKYSIEFNRILEQMADFEVNTDKKGIELPSEMTYQIDELEKVA